VRAERIVAGPLVRARAGCPRTGRQRLAEGIVAGPFHLPHTAQAAGSSAVLVPARSDRPMREVEEARQPAQDPVPARSLRGCRCRTYEAQRQHQHQQDATATNRVARHSQSSFSYSMESGALMAPEPYSATGPTYMSAGNRQKGESSECEARA